jgi:hypothetical protein
MRFGEVFEAYMAFCVSILGRNKKAYAFRIGFESQVQLE